MDNKYLKKLFLVSTLCLPVSAMADWPVAIVDKVAAHPAQARITIDALENDIGDGLEITTVNAWSENGARVSRSSNSITYRPPQNYTGEDGFWYAIKDSQGRTNSVRVSVNVLPSSSALPAPQEDSATTPRDTSIRIDVVKNDLFSTATLTGASNGGGSITAFDRRSKEGGTIEKINPYPDVIAIDLSELRYTPPKGFVGTDTFWYSVRDTKFTQTGTLPQATKVTITVLANNKIQDPYPIARPDTADVICVGVRFGCTRDINIAGNDSGNNLIYKINSSWSLRGGMLRLGPSGLAAGTRISYTPKNGFSGEDKVWYVIEDEYGRKNWAVVTLNVTRED